MSERMPKAALLLFVVTISLAASASGQCPVGDVTLDSQTAVAAFPSDCLDLAGSLFIEDTDPTADPVVDLGPLANLETIGGILRLERLTMLQEASFPALTSAGSVRLLGSSVETLRLPELQTASGILIDQNLGVAPIDQLQLTSLDLSSLATVNAFQMSFSALASLSLPSLTTAGIFELRGNYLLTELSLPLLSSVGDYFYLSSHAVLERLELPSLTSVQQLVVTGNPVLTSIALPALETIGSLSVDGNSSLSDCCFVTEILPLIEPDGSVFVRDNAPGCNTIEEIEAVCNSLTVPTLGTWGLLLLGFAVAVAGLVSLRH